MVLGMTTSRDVPNNQHGQGHLVGMEFTTMDLLSHWSQGWRSGYGTFHFLAQTELLSSALLVPGSNQIWKSSKLILSSTLPDHRGCLTGGTCCSGVELPAPQVGLGAACFPSWLPRSTGNIIISHILLMDPLWKTKRPLLFAGGADTLLLTPARHCWESCLSPPTLMKCPFCQAPNPCLTPNLPLLPWMPHGSPEAGAGSSHLLPPGAPGGLCSPWWDCSAVCEGAAT